MKRPVVRCRCGHQVLAKEVLRTDLYERPSGREYVYVKYRCQRCKRMGETFVAEHRWDWRIFEAARHEFSETESELFSSRAPISSEDVIDLHQQLLALNNLRQLAAETDTSEKPSPLTKTEVLKKLSGESKPATEGKSGIKKSAEPNPKKSHRPDDGNTRL